MKRAGGADNRDSPKRSMNTHPTTTSPLRARQFKGVSPLSDYELLDIIGEDTHGVVHKAIHKATNTVVALKHVMPKDEKDGIPMTACREIRILKQLDHENVIPLLEMVVAKGDPVNLIPGMCYMALPYVERDLAELLEDQVHLTPAEIKSLFKQLLEGTAYLHQRRVLHRDIKAENLLINRVGVLQIADFSLARTMDGREVVEYTNPVVSRWYRAPELILGEHQFSTSVDMWGVGCILGALLTRRPILRGNSDMDQLKKIFHLCGSPTEETMPGWQALPDAGSFCFEPSERRVRQVFEGYDPMAIDLLDKFLMLNPEMRLSALDALEHDYFYTDPLPTRLSLEEEED